jgi:hypothetical protein
MSVYENTRTVATRTKLETHLLNNDCVLVRETQTFEDVASEGFKFPKSVADPVVFEYVMTSAMLTKRLAGKPWKPGIPVVRPQYDKKPRTDYLRLTVRGDDWMERFRTGLFKDNNDSYAYGREDVYTAIVEDGMPLDNLIVRDTENNYYDRYGKRLAAAIFFGYIGGGSVTSRRYRDMKAVAEILLARDDVRIINEEGWNKKTRHAKTVDVAVDTVPYYNRDSYPGGEMIQFYWTPTQEVFDRALTAQSENGRQRVWDAGDFRETVVVDLDLFGLNQYRWTKEELKARDEARCNCED